MDVYIFYNIKQSSKTTTESAVMKNRCKNYKRLAKLVIENALIFAISTVPLSLIG